MGTEAKRMAVTDRLVIAEILQTLALATGADRVMNLTLSEDGTFRGNCVILAGAIGGGPLYLAFKMNPEAGTMSYEEATISRDAIDSPGDERSDAPGRSRRLRCNTGNVQCGGKCQNAKKNCFAYMNPVQKAAAMKALRLARKSGGEAPSFSLSGTQAQGPSPAPTRSRTPLAGAGETPRRSAAKLPDGVTKTDVPPREYANRYGTTAYSFKVGGTEYKVEVIGRDNDSAGVMFTRGGGLMSRPARLSEKDSATAAVKIARIMKAHTAGLPDGYKLDCEAYKADGLGAYRGRAYENQGYTRPAGGKIGGPQFAKVVGGKLVPDTDRLAKNELRGEKDKADVRWAKNVKALEDKRATAREARSAPVTPANNTAATPARSRTRRTPLAGAAETPRRGGATAANNAAATTAANTRSRTPLAGVALNPRG